MSHSSGTITGMLIAFVAIALFGFAGPVTAQEKPSSKAKSSTSKKDDGDETKSSTKKSTKKGSSTKESTKENAKESSEDSKESAVQKELKETSGRLPKYFGQIELKDEQILEIYKLQNSYQKEIEELEKKLADLKEKMNSEAEKVLTTTQRSALKKLRGDSDSKASTTKKSTTSKSTTK